MTQINSTKQSKLYQFLLLGGVVVLLAYTSTYLLAVSPMLIRVIGPLFGS
ncbi:MAG: hypothetical protein WAN46_07665 [Gammaproteobacteria bacterium]|jgi:hypothetical protein